MPLVSLTRYKAPSTTVNQDGTYTVQNLAFTGPVTVTLDATTFDKSGDYVLFKYSTFPGGPNGPQWDLDNYLLPNITLINEPTGKSGVESLTNQPGSKRVIARLGSNKENGCHYVNGDLTFTGPPNVTLNTSLYATPGNYKLFVVGGILTGLSYLNGHVIVSGSSLRQVAPVFTTVNSGITTVWIPLGA